MVKLSKRSLVCITICGIWLESYLVYIICDRWGERSLVYSTICGRWWKRYIVYSTIYGRMSVDRIATQSMSRICDLWHLIVGDWDFVESYAYAEANAYAGHVVY